MANSGQSLPECDDLGSVQRAGSESEYLVVALNVALLAILNGGKNLYSE